jgi:hypothetical protein
MAPPLLPHADHMGDPQEPEECSTPVQRVTLPGAANSVAVTPVKGNTSGGGGTTGVCVVCVWLRMLL